MRSTSRAALIAAVILGLYCQAAAQELSSATASRKPIVLRIDRADGRVVLSIKPNPTPGEGELWALSQLLKSHGADYPVLVLLDSRASVSDLSAAGILDKVGFTNVRTFVAYRDTGYMAEIRIGPSFALTHEPPWTSAH